MAFTIKDLKAVVRQNVFPQREASNLVVPHNRQILDALVDIQKWVECWQQDNTTEVPHCATLYNCGLTSFDFSRAFIKQLSVVDRIDPTTHRESAEVDTDYCAEIFYEEVDYCFIESYFAAQRRNKQSFCPNLTQFFAIPQALCGGKTRFPTPTDEGLAAGLPLLPFGFHYAQTSTDSTRGRARKGYWAKNRSKIFVTPWIQSTESILVYWDGIKREWLDADLIENDPILIEAIINWVRWKTKVAFNDIPGDAISFRADYFEARKKLIHDCNEETRIRMCEPSKARGSSTTFLYFNDAQQATASCPANQTGDPKTYTVPADSVGSTISKADANQRALQAARDQAAALLVCEDIPVTYWNTPQTANSVCSQEEGAPIPEGSPSTVTIPANTFSSIVSQADADAQALAEAQAQADAQSTCLWWNRAVSYTADCDEATEVTVAEHTYSSSLSQADADQKAFNAAKVEGDEQCPTVYHNTARGPITRSIACACGGVNVIVSVDADYVTSTVSQADANQRADNEAISFAQSVANVKCASNRCGTFTYSLPHSGLL